MGFFALGAGRQFNEMGVQPLLFSEIFAYMNDRGIFDPDERREFERYVRALDGTYVRLAQEKMSRERERLHAKSSSSSVGRKGR